MAGDEVGVNGSTVRTAREVPGAGPERAAPGPWSLLAAFGLFALGLLTAGWNYFRSYEPQFRAGVEAQLSSVADLKVAELERYRWERLGDADLVAGNAAFASLTERVVTQPADGAAAAALRAWLDRLRTVFEYERASLVDPVGRVLVSVPAGEEPLAAEVHEQLPAALRSSKAVFIDFYRGDADGRVHLEVLAPVRSPDGSGGALAVVALQIDPESYLFPLLERWPTSSRSAETLLVRREGEEVVFLNELRFQKGTALALRRSVAAPDLPAARAARGETGIVDGIDYRGVPVIAALRQVAGTPWALVARIDRSEALAPVRERLGWLLGAGIAVALAAGASVGAIWRHQRSRFYRSRAEVAEAARVSAERFHRLIQRAPVPMVLVQADGRLSVRNDRFLELFGYTVEEVPTLDAWWKAAYPDEGDRDQVRGRWRVESEAARQAGRDLGPLELEVTCRDGSVRQVSFSSTVIGEETLAALVDVTERRRAEQALAENRQLLQDIVDNGPMLIYVTDLEGRFLLVNRHLAALFASDRERMVGATRQELMPQALAESHRANDLEVIRAGAARVVEEENVEADGRHVYVSVKYPIFDARGRIYAIGGMSTDITERKRMEEALEAEKERFRIAAETSNDIVYEWDLAERVDWHGRIDEMLGYGSGEFPRTLSAWKAVVHPEDRERVAAAIAAHLEQRAPYRIDYRVLRRDGSVRYWAARGAIARRSDGSPIRWVGTVTDVTAVREAEERLADQFAALGASEERYRELHERMMDAYVRVDMTGRIVEWNEAFLDLVGYQAGEVADLSYVDLTPERWHGLEQRIVDEQILPRGYSDLYEKEYRRKDGTTVAIQLRTILSRGERGEPLGMWAVIRDVSERRRAEEALRESETKYRALFESMAEGVAIHEIVRGGSGTAVDYRILDINPAWERHTGIAGEKARGRLASAVYPGSAPPYLAEYERVSRTGESISFETYFEPLKRHFNISVVSPRPGRFATVFEDITVRKNQEEELRAKNAELERFTYLVSHDLKSPLVTVKTFLGYLEEDLAAGDTARIEKDRFFLRAATDKMGRLLEDLLELSRVGRVVRPPVEVHLGELVTEACEAVAGRIVRQGVKVERNGRDLLLRGDRLRLAQIWQNLLENAIKYMGDQPAPRVSIEARGEGRHAVFAVRDNGIGIDPRFHGRVFGLFEKLDPGTEGTGLGLALVKRVVELYGGEIWLESGGAGHGTTVSFTLPEAVVVAGEGASP